MNLTIRPKVVKWKNRRADSSLFRSRHLNISDQGKRIIYPEISRSLFLLLLNFSSLLFNMIVVCCPASHVKAMADWRCLGFSKNNRAPERRSSDFKLKYLRGLRKRCSTVATKSTLMWRGRWFSSIPTLYALWVAMRSVLETSANTHVHRVRHRRI